MHAPLSIIVTKLSLDCTMAVAAVTAFGWLISAGLFCAYWTWSCINRAVQAQTLERLGLPLSAKEPQC